MNGIGKTLQNMRGYGKIWLFLFFAVLAVLVGLNFVIHPHHPHFGLDKFAGFFAGFGLFVGLGMVIIMKKLIQPLIARDEDYYDK